MVAISRDPANAAITTDGVTGISTAANNVLDREALQALFAEHAPFDILISAAVRVPPEAALRVSSLPPRPVPLYR